MKFHRAGGRRPCRGIVLPCRSGLLTAIVFPNNRAEGRRPYTVILPAIVVVSCIIIRIV